jgi:hypothetical protein
VNDGRRVTVLNRRADHVELTDGTQLRLAVA